MKEYDVCGVNVRANFEEFSFEDATKAVDHVCKARPDCKEPLEWGVVRRCRNGGYDVDFQFRGEKFERIRRITGK